MTFRLLRSILRIVLIIINAFIIVNVRHADIFFGVILVRIYTTVFYYRLWSYLISSLLI